MLRELVRAAALAVVLCFCATARAEEPPPRAPLVFVADPKLGVETSVRTLDSLGRLAFRYEDALPSSKLGTSDPERLARYWLEVLRLVFLDAPLAELTSTVTHEVAGHGGRGRELGLRPTYKLSLPGIYRTLFSADVDGEVGGFTRFETKGIVEGTRALVGSSGGLEANYVHAWWINARIARDRGWVHHGDLLVYAYSKIAYVDTFMESPSKWATGTSGDDVASYVEDLQSLSNGWRSEDRRRIAKRLQAGYLWNLADPTLLYALYATLEPFVRARHPMRMPLPTIGDTTLLLSPRFGLTPFGAEQALDVFLTDRRGRMLDVYGRVGTSGLWSYHGLGARLFGLPAGDRVRLGGELDLWRQPELLLDQRGVFDPPMRLGMNAGLFGDVRITDVFGLTGKLAAKTPGYVAGQPLEGGLHGYVGASIAWR